MKNIELAREHGDGWGTLVEHLLARADGNGYTVQQCKEKFGTLRFYYTPGDVEDKDFESAVENAETASAHICELCGRDGKLMTTGHWLKTLCKECGIYLSYKEIVK